MKIKIEYQNGENPLKIVINTTGIASPEQMSESIRRIVTDRLGLDTKFSHSNIYRWNDIMTELRDEFMKNAWLDAYGEVVRLQEIRKNIDRRLEEAARKAESLREKWVDRIWEDD